MENKYCLNCNAALIKSQNFCSQCGQSASTHRFTIVSFFHEGFHAITHADKGLFYLLKELTIRPGIVARAYIDGKRKKYFNPFTFFLLLMALYVFVNTFVGAKELTNSRPMPESISAITDVEVRKSAENQYNRGVEARRFMTKNGNLVAMLAIPFFALFFRTIYYRGRYNYVEHLVANLMFVTLANLAFTLIVFPLQALLIGSPWASMTNILGFVLQAFYFTIAYKGFMELKGGWPTVKIAIFSFIGIMLWAILSISLIAIYVMRSIHFYDYFKHLG